MLILVSVVSVCCASEAEKEDPANFWQLTRYSEVVLKGVVESANAHVTLRISITLKGQVQSETAKFATPKNSQNIKFKECCPGYPQFVVGEECIVFLNKNEAGEYILVHAAMSNLADQAEQSIKDLHDFEKLESDIDKCNMLVSLISPHKGLRSLSAAREIYTFNRPQFLELLEPLSNDPSAKMIYISLLGGNSNPNATERLRELLTESNKETVLTQVISVLRRKNLKDDNLSRELLKYIRHESSQVRTAAIFALEYRGYRDGVDDVAICLDDEDPHVRSMAVYYLSGVQKNKDVIEKIKKLRNDSNEYVREAVYRYALPLNISYFYDFLKTSLLDKSKNVRRAASKLDIIWERRPFIMSLFLLWPCILASAIVFCALGTVQKARRILVIAIGAGAGYIGGIPAGYLIGEHHSSRVVFCVFILIPPLFMPISVLLSGLISRYGRTLPVSLLLLLAIILSIFARVITSSNTLWPSVLMGFIVMVAILSLCDFGFKKVPYKETYNKENKL